MVPSRPRPLACAKEPWRPPAAAGDSAEEVVSSGSPLNAPHKLAINLAVYYANRAKAQDQAPLIQGPCDTESC